MRGHSAPMLLTEFVCGTGSVEIQIRTRALNLCVNNKQAISKVLRSFDCSLRGALSGSAAMRRKIWSWRAASTFWRSRRRPSARRQQSRRSRPSAWPKRSASARKPLCPHRCSPLAPGFMDLNLIKGPERLSPVILCAQHGLASSLKRACVWH